MDRNLARSSFFYPYRGVARESGIPNVYFAVGNLSAARMTSKVLALQIKAQQEGIFPERCECVRVCVCVHEYVCASVCVCLCLLLLGELSERRAFARWTGPQERWWARAEHTMYL